MAYQKSPTLAFFPLSKSPFSISPPHRTIRVTNCSQIQFLISFHWKTCTIGALDNNIPYMGGVFDKLHAKFKNRTRSVRNAELVIYASLAPWPYREKHTWLNKFNNKNTFTFVILFWTLRSQTVVFFHSPWYYWRLIFEMPVLSARGFKLLKGKSNRPFRPRFTCDFQISHVICQNTSHTRDIFVLSAYWAPIESVTWRPTVCYLSLRLLSVRYK